MSAERKQLWGRLATFLLLTVAIGLMWAAAFGYLADKLIISQMNRGRVIEGVKIRGQGEPVITQAYYGTSFESLPDLTLDRQLAPPSQEPPPSSAYFYRPEGDYRGGPLTWWEWRLLEVYGRHDEQRRERWFVVRDASKEGHAYLVGYDVPSRLSVGYIGRQGFRRGLPPLAEQFVVGDFALRLQDARFRGDPAAHSDSPLCLYMFDEDRLIEVEPSARTVREILEIPEAKSMATVVQFAERDLPRDADGSLIRKSRWLAVWNGSKLTLVDPATADKSTYALPPELAGVEAFNIYFTGPNEAVIDYLPSRRNYWNHELLWTTAAGEVTRRESVELASYRLPTHPQNASLTAIVAPAPAAMALVVGWLLPVDDMRYKGHSSYSEGLRTSLAAAWPATLVLLAASAAMAWYVWRTHRRDGGRYAGLWATAVFLLGLPGLLAYLADRRAAPTAVCPACGVRSARNRVDCAACGEDAFLPRILGTEVFA